MKIMIATYVRLVVLGVIISSCAGMDERTVVPEQTVRETGVEQWALTIDNGGFGDGAGNLVLRNGQDGGIMADGFLPVYFGEASIQCLFENGTVHRRGQGYTVTGEGATSYVAAPEDIRYSNFTVNLVGQREGDVLQGSHTIRFDNAGWPMIVGRWEARLAGGSDVIK
jgi:hypothetical protein